MRKDLLSQFGEFQNGLQADLKVISGYLKGESLVLHRVKGRYVLDISDAKGLVAIMEFSGIVEGLDAFHRSFPMLGSLHLLREHGLLFPDQLNN